MACGPHEDNKHHEKGTGEYKSLIDTEFKDKDTKRWYTLAQKQKGRLLFAEHCASCHGDKRKRPLIGKRQQKADTIHHHH